MGTNSGDADLYTNAEARLRFEAYRCDVCPASLRGIVICGKYMISYPTKHERAKSAWLHAADCKQLLWLLENPYQYQRS